MTLPTKLTVSRILLTFVIIGLLLSAGWVAKAAALVGFLIASLTDWLDGYLARRWHQTSALGALLDPIADKVLVLGMFIAFIQLDLVSTWMVLVIVLRDLVITGVRLFAYSQHVVLAAAKEGKHKTVSQMLTIILILVVLLLREWVGRGHLDRDFDRWAGWSITIAMWVTVILTLISGASFFWRHRAVLKDAVGH